jgi:hypothetical protein
MPVVGHQQFACDQSLHVEHYADDAVARIAAAIGEKA